MLEPAQHHARPGIRGFTLIEMMIAVAVLAILGAIAYPSFIEQIRKSRRSDGIAALNQAMQAQERYRSNNPAYAAAITDLTGAVATSEKGYYTIAVKSGSTSATGYELTATATGAQASDAKCTSLSVVMAGGNISYNSAGTGTSALCWNR